MSKILPVSDDGAPSTPPHDQTPLIVPAPPAKNAAAVESTERSCFLLTNARVGRRSKFTAEDDIILLRKDFETRANVVPQSETREWFEVVVPKANASRKPSFVETQRIVQDRYKRLQARADDAEKRGS